MRNKQRSEQTYIPAGLGLPNRRFPFRPENAAERQQLRPDVETVLRGVDAMIRSLVRRAQNQFGLDDDQASDMHAAVMERLWRRSLPNFDAALGHKVSTFLHACACKHIIHQVRTVSRQHRRRCREQLSPSTAIDRNLSLAVAPQDVSDRRIEAVARQVIQDPERYLTPWQAQVLRTLLEHPHAQKQEIARMLGYERASSLSTMLLRIRERITEIDLHDA